MRRLLDALYNGAAWLAALLMVGLLLMVLLSIVSRLLHFYVPGTDAYAGYLMASSGFLALAHTLKKGEHIRVTLLLSYLKGGVRRAFEIWALAAASTTSPPPTTPRPCGFRNWAWPSARRSWRLPSSTSWCLNFVGSVARPTWRQGMNEMRTRSLPPGGRRAASWGSDE